MVGQACEGRVGRRKYSDACAVDSILESVHGGVVYRGSGGISAVEFGRGGDGGAVRSSLHAPFGIAQVTHIDRPSDDAGEHHETESREHQGLASLTMAFHGSFLQPDEFRPVISMFLRHGT